MILIVWLPARSEEARAGRENKRAALDPARVWGTGRPTTPALVRWYRLTKTSATIEVARMVKGRDR